MSSAPLLWLIIGANGAGKSTYYDHWVGPRTALPFINADRIARERWPKDPESHSRRAAIAADEQRSAMLDARASFATETVFSHPARLQLLERARAAGYDRWVTWVGLEAAGLAVARVADRVAAGGHAIPEEKVRARYARLVPLAVEAVLGADRAFVVDNTSAERPLRPVVAFERGTLTYRVADTPRWVERAFADSLE